MLIREDFDINVVLKQPLMAHLSTVEGAPRDSAVWFIWEESSAWIFGETSDSFVRRLTKEPRCALGVVDFDVQKGILKHVNIRGTAQILDPDRDRLTRFLIKYIGENKSDWNPWFIKNIVDPINCMVQVIPQSIVAKDLSFFKTGPQLAS
jgi:hypothetical protein